MKRLTLIAAIFAMSVCFAVSADDAPAQAAAPAPADQKDCCGSQKCKDKEACAKVVDAMKVPCKDCKLCEKCKDKVARCASNGHKPNCKNASGSMGQCMMKGHSMSNSMKACQKEQQAQASNGQNAQASNNPEPCGCLVELVTIEAEGVASND